MAKAKARKKGKAKKRAAKKARAKAKAKPRVKAKPKARPRARARAKAKARPRAKAKARPKAKAKVKARPRVKAKPKAKPKGSRGPKPLPSKPEPRAAAKPAPAAPPAAPPPPKPAAAPAPAQKPPAPAPAAAPKGAPTPAGVEGGVPGLKLKPREESTPLGNEDLAHLEVILKRYNSDPVYILSMLQDIQDIRNYIPRAFIDEIAGRLKIPRTRIYRIATFFKALSLTPRGKTICTVCVGTTCHVRGAPKLIDKVERDFQLKAGETTPDMKLTLETVGCVGACALGPLIVLNGKYHGHMTTEKLGKVLKNLD